MADVGSPPDDETLATAGPQASADADTLPALVNAGHADAAGSSEGGRLFFIADGLELGRRPVAPPGGTSWYIPDGRVSAQHARISRLGKTLNIVDLGSRNGTFVNGRRIAEPTKLVDGDVILIGRQAAVFRWLTGEQTRAITEELSRPFGPTAAVAPVMAVLLQRLRRLAPSREEVLLTGETGVGKEVYAQAIHTASGRSGPFLAINCAALPVELVESELFGFARGAHSQASEGRPGLLARSDGGTLFLDEIGDMPPGAQAKLLRFLQTRSYQPLGGVAARTLDVRVLAATTRAAPEPGGQGLRSDLAGRLGAEPLVIPPLRQRPEDLGALVALFLGARGPKRLEGAAFATLLAHSWPQNVRELEKVVRQAALFAEGADVVRQEHLPLRLRGPGPAAVEGGRVETEAALPPEFHRGRSGTPWGFQVSDSQETAQVVPRAKRRPMPDREALVDLLKRYRGNVAEVARHLGRHWGVVQRALAKHDIDADSYRPAEDDDPT